VLDEHNPVEADALPAVLDADRWARIKAGKLSNGTSSAAR
jgi:hypothetical protein